MTESKPTESQKTHIVTQSDLPLSCPLPGQTLWSEHPKVYLPIDRTGEAVCPYCSAKYILKDKS